MSINPNGYERECSFEYILNETGGSRNSCDGQKTVLPRGTTFQLFAAGRDANPVHISHQGTPYPDSNGRVYREGSTTVAFRTIDVWMTPTSEALWHIKGVTRAGTWLTGPHTLRLVQNNLYHLSVDTGKVNADTGQPEYENALFKLEPRCDAPAQTTYVGGYGFSILCKYAALNLAVRR